MESNSMDQRESDGLAPVWGCVLIGGESARMGTPKHLLQHDGLTWLEIIVSRLKKRTEQVVISGQGEIPDSLKDIPVVEDVGYVHGPLAGILSILRKYPDVSWLVVGCDMPDINTAAMDWILEQRTNATRAILPDLYGNGQVEPLLAYYDRNCLDLIEKNVLEGSSRPGDLVSKPGIETPLVPDYLRSAWKNINYPEELGS